MSLFADNGLNNETIYDLQVKELNIINLSIILLTVIIASISVTKVDPLPVPFTWAENPLKKGAFHEYMNSTILNTSS
jgi:hypothetical protein